MGRAKLLNRTKNRTLVTCVLSNINKMAYFYAACVVRVTIFSTEGKFHPVSNFTYLYALTQVARSYALLMRIYSYILLFYSVVVHGIVCAILALRLCTQSFDLQT